MHVCVGGREDREGAGCCFAHLSPPDGGRLFWRPSAFRRRRRTTTPRAPLYSPRSPPTRLEIHIRLSHGESALLLRLRRPPSLGPVRPHSHSASRSCEERQREPRKEVVESPRAYSAHRALPAPTAPLRGDAVASNRCAPCARGPRVASIGRGGAGGRGERKAHPQTSLSSCSSCACLFCGPARARWVSHPAVARNDPSLVGRGRGRGAAARQVARARERETNAHFREEELSPSLQKIDHPGPPFRAHHPRPAPKQKPTSAHPQQEAETPPGKPKPKQT